MGHDVTPGHTHPKLGEALVVLMALGQLQGDLHRIGWVVCGIHHFVADRLDDPPAQLGDDAQRLGLEVIDQTSQLICAQGAALSGVADDVGKTHRHRGGLFGVLR